MNARLGPQVDDDVVHAHRPHLGVAPPSDQGVGVVGQRPAPAVAVADRQHAERRVALGDEPPSIAGALPRDAGLDVGHPAAQLECRLEGPRRRVGVEGIQPIDGDAAAHHVEVGGGVAQRGGAVGRVHEHPGMALLDLADPFAEAPQLLAGRRKPRRASRRVKHGARLARVARAQPAHAGVELYVHPYLIRSGGAWPRRLALGGVLGEARHEARTPGHDVGAGVERRPDLLAAERPHHQDRPPEAGPTQLGSLVGGGHGQPRGAAGQGGPGAGDRAVAVAVGLDHGAQGRGLIQLAAQPSTVALDGRKVYSGQRARGH